MIFKIKVQSKDLYLIQNAYSTQYFNFHTLYLYRYDRAAMVLILDGSSVHGGVNQLFRFVEGIWLHRKSSQIRHYFFLLHSNML